MRLTRFLLARRVRATAIALLSFFLFVSDGAFTQQQADANSIIYVLASDLAEGPYLVGARGAIRSELNAGGTTTGLVEPTIWVFRFVPSELSGLVEEHGAYFRDGDEWIFVRFIDPDLNLPQAASLFGVLSENTTMMTISF